jgi:RNA polymerase sporulation-specific sigma factor
MIIGEIKKFLRDDGIVKVQRGLKELYSKIRWAQDKLRSELGREPTVIELSDLIHIDKEEIVMAIEACQSPAYMYDSFGSDEKEQLSLIDRLGQEETGILMLEKMALQEAMSKLDSREREVIMRRFFKDETQSSIAEDLGVSQVQISRIEKGALMKLKQMLA